MIKLLLINILFLVTFYFCSDQNSLEQDSDVFNSKTLIAYVEAKTEKGNLSGEFGDIIILDYESGKKYKVSDDEFYDSKPCLSPDNKHVFFFTNRDRTPIELKMNSAGYPFQLYEFDVALNKLFSLANSFHNSTSFPFNELNDTSVDWFPDSGSFLLEYDNKLFRIFLNEHIIEQIFYSPGSNNKINRFNLSPNGKYIIIYLTHYEHNIISFKNNLQLLRLEDSTVEIIDSEILFEHGCWTSEGKYVYAKTKYGVKRETTYLSYDPLNNQKDQLFYPDSLDIFIINNKYLIAEILNGESSELCKYFPETNTYQKITNDGKQKSDFSRF